MIKPAKDDFIYVKRITQWEEISPAGIIMLKTDQDEDLGYFKGVVVSFAANVDDLEVGNEISYNINSGKKVWFEGKEYELVHMQNVLGVWN